MRISIVLTALAVSLSASLASVPAARSADSGQSLHRVDFRIEGASCVTCLRRIAKSMRESKGVLKADASIYRPYWAIAIYDAKKTTFDKFSAPIAKSEQVRFAEVEDKPISSMPLVVIPKVSSTQAKAPMAAPTTR